MLVSLNMHDFRSNLPVVVIGSLLLFMGWWVLLWPASYRVGWWPGYDALLDRIVAEPSLATPLDVFSKYASHAAVKLTHLIPSGVWSLCGALQLSAFIRNSAPRIHRLSGRVMLLCAVLVAIGYALIEARGLTTTPLRSPTFGSVVPVVASQPHLAGLRLACAWFIFTAGMALAQVRQGRYKSHSRWALRHVASGAWVIVQRLFILGLAVWAHMFGVAFSEAQRQEIFYAMSITAMMVCFTASELYLRVACADDKAVNTRERQADNGKAGR